MLLTMLFDYFLQTHTDFPLSLLSQYKPFGRQMQVHMGAPPCWMHHSVIGLWAKHIMKAIVHLYISVLQREDLVTNPKRTRLSSNAADPNEPKRTRLFSDAAVDRVMHRTGERLTCFTADDAGLRITPKYARHLYNVSVHDKGTFTAGRVENLMVVLQFVLRDLIFDEVRKINDLIDAAPRGDPLHGLEHVVDPSTDIIRVINTFVDFFTLARRYDTCVETLPVLAKRVRALQEILKEIMPTKSGDDIILYNSIYHIIYYQK